ncbi:hypothetical protein [Nostoc sp. FACHB-892]|nr:hypothetical protein [Nostoc sp. FACHB-892]
MNLGFVSHFKTKLAITFNDAIASFIVFTFLYKEAVREIFNYIDL